MAGKAGKAGKKKGESERARRVAELIRARLSEVLQHSDYGTITITELRMTPDLRHARAYVMPLGGKALEACVLALNEDVARIKHKALSGLRLRYMPNLHFVADTSFDKGAAMDELLSRLPAKQTDPSSKS